MGKKSKKWLCFLISVIGISVAAVLFIITNNNNKSSNVIIEGINVEENKEGNTEQNHEEITIETNETNEEEKDDKKENDKFMILVNKENLLEADYEPENLVLSEIEFLSYIETRSLTQETADAAKEMFDAALKDGITLLGASGYRSYDIQVNLFNSRAAQIGEEEASKYTAPPGASEHQTGLALDILGTDYLYMDDDFDQSESFKWLKENCYKYGFILRFLKGKEDITGYGYEPWHFRYIGNSDIAEEIMKNNLTFEEYLKR